MTTQDARQETDDSLAIEREKADAALAAQAQVELEADGVIERARQDAAEVLALARAQADAQLATAPSPAARSDEEAATELATQRTRADRALDDEHAAADQQLRHERDLEARALAQLLPLEREKTDLFLLTERARSDDALANRDDFLGMVSHDLRGMLNGIVLAARMVADHVEPIAAAHPALQGTQQIQRFAGRMNRLIGDLVDVASIDAGKLRVQPHTADVVALVRESQETWAQPAASRGITLEVTPSAPLRALCDPQRIVQILGNLITNSLKFSARGTTVVLGVEAVADGARFSVRDQGEGVPAGDREAIFEKFWQVGQDDRRGLGLGLYISRCLVQAHGGRIWVESELGVGSAFFFTVPRAP